MTELYRWQCNKDLFFVVACKPYSLLLDRVDTLQDRQTDFFENCSNLKSTEKEEQFAEVKVYFL